MLKNVLIIKKNVKDVKSITSPLRQCGITIFKSRSSREKNTESTFPRPFSSRRFPRRPFVLPSPFRENLIRARNNKINTAATVLHCRERDLIQYVSKGDRSTFEKATICPKFL
eukprot:TRINITY_DN23488_c0_g1_i1.p1 TRINITY_DN23488_c0_g1~~TRINITY_DN23488_c0_g1_i1.p1  ORF type:complete len:113 (+),score=22.13 TRINITY_DN23488_c0_g1_i1:17-355(+)